MLTPPPPKKTPHQQHKLCTLLSLTFEKQNKQKKTDFTAILNTITPKVYAAYKKKYKKIIAQPGPYGKKKGIKSLRKQNSTYVGVSGCEEDGEGW